DAPAQHHRGLDDQQHGRAHVRSAGRPRSEELQADPHARHLVEGGGQHHVGVRPAQGRQVPQRRALRCPERQGDHGLHQGPRQQDYWKGKPELKKVTFRFIPEFSARLAALLAGEIDIMKDVPPHAVDLVNASGKATVRATVSSRINYLALVNLKQGPMQDLKVRKAIAQSVNVDELIQNVLRGRASKMCGPLSPINVDYSPNGQCLKYDPKQAQALFKEAGVDPKTLTLTLDTPSGRYPLDKDISQ